MSEPKATYKVRRKPRKANKTRKLSGAAGILSSEQYCDCYPDEILWAVGLGVLTAKSVYFGMDRLGYSWNKQKQIWWRRYPSWVIGWHRESSFAEARRLGRGDFEE